MRLSRLAAELSARQPIEWASAPAATADPEVTGVSHDSRRVSPGDLFAALAGERFDGRRFVPQAARRGAVAVLAGAPPEEEAGAAGLPWLIAEAPRELLGPLAAEVYDRPDRELALIGVTGTNGKSTVAVLLAAMLEAAGRPAAVLGTLGYRFGALSFPGERTTPEASDLFRMLRRMADAGAEAAAMEVSSHALALHRVAGASFQVAVFTNLTQDHLDFHGDFESYFAAKRRLFSLLAPGGQAVLNTGDPYGRRLAAEMPDAVTYRVDGAGGGESVQVEEMTLDLSGARGVLATPRGPLAISTPLLGRFNLENLAAAVAAAEALGLPHAAVAAALAAQRPVPGRLEPVTGPGSPAGDRYPILIDYAHTDGALSAALSSLRELAGDGARLIVVFGAGGDRDRGKRPLMGRAAGALSDLAVLTSDNPRSEDPLAIIAAVEEGLAGCDGARWQVEPDRRAAIRLAVAEAERVHAAGGRPVLLVAGKGHEETQTVGDRVLPFSDRDEILAALEVHADGEHADGVHADGVHTDGGHTDGGHTDGGAEEADGTPGSH